jgi:hypothetical protein
MLTMTTLRRTEELTMTTLRRLWTSDATLTATGLLMLAALGGFVAGLWLDPRLITGAPTWLKPAKFAVSIAIYTFTLAWIFTYLRDWVRMRRIVGRTTAVVLVAEVAIIALQAWRGTTSHFNVGTVFDTVLFAVMGLAIVVQTLASVAVALALWRQPFADRALGWALRLGMVITIVGASTGGLMTQPTPAQVADARAGQRMTISGAHTVGAADGGPGLPGTGWSREHGDLRAPHFLGLHALQALPLILFVIVRRRVADPQRVRLTWVAAASYFALFAILLAQALGGESVTAPSTGTVAALAAWALGTAAAAWFAASGAMASRRTIAVLG